MDDKSVKFRRARRAELPAVVQMLADDILGSEREAFREPLPESYHAAFEAIDADPNNDLIVAVLDDQVVGTLQLTFVPSLSFQGRWRAQVESVRVDADFRGRGIGRRMMLWAIEQAGERGCHMVQLSSNRRRTDARRFYESLGFEASHIGLKLILESD
jgi:ribosomal protein S18 acetylase RimI-like enzyme